MPKVTVYLDNCAYNRPFDDQGQIKIALETEAKRHIQRLIVEKKIDLAYSFINRIEGRCGYFITTDKPVLKHKRGEIIICSPIQFLDYYEEEQNESD